jgi:hypothetical protein
MAGLVPAIHVLSGIDVGKKTWMPGTSPGVTAISTAIQRGGRPLRHIASCEKAKRSALNSGHLALALRNRNQQVAAPGHGDADGRMP